MTQTKTETEFNHPTIILEFELEGLRVKTNIPNQYCEAFLDAAIELLISERNRNNNAESKEQS